jgi:hypothetical protein
MVARRAVPENLQEVETRRLAQQLTTETAAVLAALDTFLEAPATASSAALVHVRSWARDAARDARRLHQVLV